VHRRRHSKQGRKGYLGIDVVLARMELVDVIVVHDVMVLVIPSA
jgi:hypothetical protein